jgi:dCTP deaminase
MILSDREIRAAMERGALRITPPPPLEVYSSTAVDLTLGPELRTWSSADAAGAGSQVRPASPGFNVTAILDRLTERVLIGADGYELKPGQFVLGWTAEKIRLPHRARLAARVEGKSSLARLGLGIHVTAPTIHAGFGYREGDEGHEGTPLQLEIWNVGLLPIVLDTGLPICQLIFEAVDGTPDKG